MKRTVLSLLAFFIAMGAMAQMIRSEEIEKYVHKKYGDRWQDIAYYLSRDLELDKNKSLTYVQIIDCPGKTSAQLYVALNHWFTTMFNDDRNNITLNDKQLGTIVGHGFVEGIANHTGGLNHYVVSIRPVIKADIKEGRVRVTYTLPYYSVSIVDGGGYLGTAFEDMRHPKPKDVYDVKWAIDECYPFVTKDSHKLTSSKALVMSHAFSNIIIDRIEDAVKHGLIGNENDDW